MNLNSEFSIKSNRSRSKVGFNFKNLRISNNALKTKSYVERNPSNQYLITPNSQNTNNPRKINFQRKSSLVIKTPNELKSIILFTSNKKINTDSKKKPFKKKPLIRLPTGLSNSSHAKNSDSESRNMNRIKTDIKASRRNFYSTSKFPKLSNSTTGPEKKHFGKGMTPSLASKRNMGGYNTTKFLKSPILKKSRSRTPQPGDINLLKTNFSTLLQNMESFSDESSEEEYKDEVKRYRFKKRKKQYRKERSYYGLKKKPSPEFRRFKILFEDWIRSIEEKFKNYFFSKEVTKCINCLCHLIFLCAEVNNLPLAYKILLFLGHTIQNFGLYNIAFGVFQQIFKLAEENHDIKLKLEVYMRLNNIAVKTKNYTQSIKILMKAVEQSWILNDRSSELMIYDKIGYTYYLNDDIGKAMYFHQRVVNNDYQRHEMELNRQIFKSLKTKQKEIEVKKSQKEKLFSFNVLHILGIKRPFYDIINKLTQNNESLQERLYEQNKSKRTQKGEKERIAKKIKRKNFIFLDVNLIAQDKPMMTLFNTEDLTSSFDEWLGLEVNKIFFPMMDKRLDKISNEQGKMMQIYQSRKVKKYRSNCDHIMPKLKTEKFNPKDFTKVKFYAKKKNTEGKYIRRVDATLHFLRNPKKHKNYMSHLSVNRDIKQFKNAFNSNLPYKDFFGDIRKSMINHIQEFDPG